MDVRANAGRLTALGVVLALLAAAADARPDAAGVRIEGRNDLALSTLREGAPSNHNRDYTVLDVPDALTGLRYVLSPHKGPMAPFTAAVERGGHLYLCFAEDKPGETASLPTPQSLKLPGSWERAGTLRTVFGDLTYHWGLFRTQVAPGQILTIPTANRWGTLLIAGEIHGLPEFMPATFGEFELLQAQLRAGRDWNQARLEREALRREALILSTDRTPVDIAWRRTQALFHAIRRLPGAADLAPEAAELTRLQPRVEALQRQPGAPEADQRRLFAEIATVRRRIAFCNPLLSFDAILFIKRHRALFNHMCDQFYGMAAQPGGGLYVLEQAFGPAPAVRDLLADATVASGRLQGQRLRGGTAGGLAYDGLGTLRDQRTVRDGGAFLSPDLSFDGRDVLFAYVECQGETTHRFPRTPAEGLWDPGRCFHLFRVAIDGSGLEQLTDGPWNDFDPCWLPDGRIAFVSDRRGGYLRCGRVCPTYTLYGMAADGGDITCLSYHETHEWQPSVNADGLLAYTRWDYVDRDSDIAHHLWTCLPDGRDPRSSHGNYPEKRELRPWMELSIRAIPGTRTKYVATAAPHHGQAFGSLVLIDLAQPDDGAMGQVRRITPEVPLPESESAPGVPHAKGTHSPNAEVFGTAWPLSEDFHLCVYSPSAAALALPTGGVRPSRSLPYGIYLVDSFGNRELLHADAAAGCSDPIPVTARRRPPVLPPAAVADAESAARGLGEIAVINVYDSPLPWPAGVRIKELRVVNLFPKATPLPDDPYIGHAAQSLARGVFGTAPVAEDGSACFRLPAGTPVYFQALDERGVAVQTMRSLTFVRPGERLVCAGCHEHRQRVPIPARGTLPQALRQPPAGLAPEAEGSYPLTFPRLVQPVLDRQCTRCHEREPKAPSLRGDRFGAQGWSEAFLTLRSRAWGMSGGNGIALNQRQTSVPGQDGALASALYAQLANGHHGVTLTLADLRRITLWLDCNSLFYGAYRETERQARGEAVLPEFGLPPVADVTVLVR
jgi:hypothetical protein